MATYAVDTAAERWFLANGLPAVLRPGALVRGLLSRSAPALTFFAVMIANSALMVAITGKHAIDIDGTPTRTEWFIMALLVLVVPMATLFGRLVSKTSRTSTRNTAAGIALAVVGVGSFYGGPSAKIHVDLLVDASIVAVIFVCTATGIGSILRWAARMTYRNLASMGNLFLGALPVLLLTVLVFFNSPVWSMASSITRGRLWAALLFLYLIAAMFLISHTLNNIRPILREDLTATDSAADRDRRLAGTPFEDMPDRLRRVPLSRGERLNVGFVIALSQLVQILTVALVTGFIFMTFGLILLSPEVLEAWTQGGTSDGEILGMILPIPNALIHVSMFLTALTFMYLAAKAVTDKEYRGQFLDPLLDDVRLTLAARDRYRAATASR